MEILNIKTLKHEKIKAAIFDFDGTISTLRQGWEQVMRPLMSEMINPYGNDDELEKLIDQYIDESTGIQTIFQMQWLVKKIKEYGKNFSVHDEWWYKDEYNLRLMQSVKTRLSDLMQGKLNPTDFMIKGSKAVLQRLKASNVDLYVASGTDNEDVVNEVKTLGLYDYFSGIAGAPYRKTECSKDAVIRNLIDNKKLKGESLLVIGDGKVEIMLGKEAGALTLGAATDEVKRYGVNEIKRQRLIKAGADAITGDFSNENELAEWLNLR
jgi:phosphoglycolate phosphatase-like HAD superfamily hydrolase